jgi:ADP-ribose pyrophosphatase YjhB (NUDIX family)
MKTPFSHKEFVERYYVHRIATLVVVLNQKDEILLTKQVRFSKKSKTTLNWGLPGGLIEKNESIMIGAIREVLEETDVHIKPTCIISISNWAGKSIFESDPYKHSGLGIILGAEYVSGIPRPADTDEIYDVGFFSQDEFNSIKLSNRINRYINAIKEGNVLQFDKKASENLSKTEYRFFFGI